MCTRIRPSSPQTSRPSSGSKRPGEGNPGSSLPSAKRAKGHHSESEESGDDSATEVPLTPAAQVNQVATEDPAPAAAEGGGTSETTSPTPAQPAGHGTVTLAQPKNTFKYNGESFVGVDFGSVLGWITPQETEHTCWAATLAHVATMVTGDLFGEAQVVSFAKERIEDYLLQRYLTNGVDPGQYQELISILKEDLGISAKEQAFSKDAAFEHLLHGRPAIVSVGKENAHVVLLLGYQEGDPGRVLVYDTAMDNGGVKTPSIEAFVSAANQMFLMDIYTPPPRGS